MEFREDRGVTFPILFDEDGSVHADYSMQSDFLGTLYPQDWIVGVDQRIAYTDNVYEPAAMVAVIEEELDR